MFAWGVKGRSLPFAFYDFIGCVESNNDNDEFESIGILWCKVILLGYYTRSLLYLQCSYCLTPEIYGARSIFTTSVLRSTGPLQTPENKVRFLFYYSTIMQDCDSSGSFCFSSQLLYEIVTLLALSFVLFSYYTRLWRYWQFLLYCSTIIQDCDATGSFCSSIQLL